jgi:Bacterial Ig-like domain/Bacterial Ig domain
MTRMRSLMLLSLLALTGCPTRPDDMKVVGTAPTPTPTPTADAAVPAGPLPALRITSPASNTSTTGTVSVVVDVSSGTAPATITLSEDGTVLGILDAPAPYRYSWDTKNTPDGKHTLLAQATVDGESIASAPVTIVVDRTSPTIVSTTPASGAANVVLRAPIVVSFSEPILASSFSSSAVTLQVGGTSVPTTATLSSDGMSATIAVNDLSSFALPATFSVTLAAMITDLVGNPLKTPTTPWSWSVPDWIKYAPVASTTLPSLAVGPTFQPVLAYTRCLTNGSTIGGLIGGSSTCVDDMFVAESDGQAWNSLGQVANLIGPGSLDLEAQGRPIVAGIASLPSGLAGIYLVSWNGSAWDTSIPPLPIDTTLDFTASPIVRLDPSGRPVVAWKDWVTGTEADVGVARWTGTAWDRSFGKFGQTNVTNHSLILDGVGNPVVGLVTFSGGGLASFSFPQAGFRAWNGTGWTSGGGLILSGPFVALGQLQEPMMIDGSSVYHFSSGAWLPAVSAPVPTSGTVGGFHLTTGTDHLPVVAWLDSTGPVKVGLARWTGTAWNARAGLFSANGVVLNTESPGVLVDARGSAWVSWREGSSVNVWMSNY